MTRSPIDRVVAAAICGAVSVVTILFSTRQGIARDEAYYMNAGERYVAYFDDLLTGRLKNPLSRESIDRYWSYNAEHPPLFKLLYGTSWRALHRCTCAIDNRWHPVVARLAAGQHSTIGLLSELTAFRLPTAVTFGWLCALAYLFYVDALGSRRGAIVAALLMFAQPRAFFHAQTASFDLPVAALWFATMYAYWRALGAESWRGAIVTGLLFGLTLATKLQSAVLPLALGAHWGWLAWMRHRQDRSNPDVRPLLSMLAAPIVLLGMWPWLWHDTLSRVRNYLAFHWNHEQYNFEYFGRNYNQPPFPWHEPLGMLVVTAPVILLVTAAAGILLLMRSSVKDDDRSTRALLLLSGALPIAVFMGGRLPIYGETKHWLATMPFLTLAAGYAIDRLGASLESELRIVGSGRRLAMSAALVLVAFVPAAAETLRSHPYGLSHYNALAGGAPGGADLGMNRQFWGYSVKGLLPWLNQRLPPRATLYLHDTNEDSYNLYMRSRALRDDIVDASSIGEPGTRFVSDAALVIHEKHFDDVDFRIWETYGHVQPAQVLTLDGVPLVSVYLRNP